MTRYVKHNEKETESIHFLEYWGRGIENIKSLCVNTVILKEVQTRKIMNSHKQIEGKLKKF